MPSESNLHIPDKCRCGKVHDSRESVDELEVAIHHACYHDGGIVPWMGFGDMGICRQCGMGFHVVGMGYPENGNYYICPVCAFPCSEPCEDYRICVCCGTEFGNDDAEASHAELRIAWLSVEPRPIFWKKDEEPKYWNPWLQLAMRYRNEGVKKVCHVGSEEMERLFESSGIKEKIDQGNLEKESIEFPGPQEKPKNS